MSKPSQMIRTSSFASCETLTETEKLRAEIEKLRAENEKLRADNEKFRAENFELMKWYEVLRAENIEMRGGDVCSELAPCGVCEQCK